MFAITFVFISAVTLVHLYTKETIKVNETLALKRAVLDAAGIKYPAGAKADEIEEIAGESIREIKGRDGGTAYYEIVKPGSDRAAGYVFQTSAPGLWGTVTAVVGLDSDLKKMTGIYFTRQNETPGLGARIDESWFRDQFSGKEGPIKSMAPELKDKNKSGDIPKDQFQAITGATITSTAVKNIVNKTYENAPILTKGGNKTPEK